MNLNEIMSPDALDPMMIAGDFSPDCRLFSYLKGSLADPSRMDLWVYDLEAKTTRLLVETNHLQSRDAPLSEEEKQSLMKSDSFGLFKNASS